MFTIGDAVELKKTNTFINTIVDDIITRRKYYMVVGMIVNGITGDGIECVWFNKDGEPRREVYNEKVLIKV